MLECVLLESHEVIIIFLTQKSQQQSQILRPNYKRISLSLKIDTKVSVLISEIETGYTESQSQSQHSKTGVAHPWLFLVFKSYQKLGMQVQIYAICSSLKMILLFLIFTTNHCRKLSSRNTYLRQLPSSVNIWIFQIWDWCGEELGLFISHWLLVLWFTFFRYGCGKCVKHASQIWQIEIHVKEHHSSKDIIERWTSRCSQIDFSYNQSVIVKIVLNNKCISIRIRYTRMTEKWLLI